MGFIYIYRWCNTRLKGLSWENICIKSRYRCFSSEVKLLLWMLSIRPCLSIPYRPGALPTGQSLQQQSLINIHTASGSRLDCILFFCLVLYCNQLMHSSCESRRLHSSYIVAAGRGSFHYYPCFSIRFSSFSASNHLVQLHAIFN